MIPLKMSTMRPPSNDMTATMTIVRTARISVYSTRVWPLLRDRPRPNGTENKEPRRKQRGIEEWTKTNAANSGALPHTALRRSKLKTVRIC